MKVEITILLSKNWEVFNALVFIYAHSVVFAAAA